MFAMTTLHVLLGVLGAVAAGADFVAPWFESLAHMAHQQAAGQRSSLNYVIALVNAIYWVFYGASPNGGVLITGVYLFGACCHVFYLYQFLKYTDDQNFDWLLVNLTTGSFVILLSGLYYLPDMKNHVAFLCWMSALCRAMLAAAPLLKLPAVFQEMNIDSLPSLTLCTIAFTNACIWTAFSITGATMDPFIFWPSLVGIAAAAVLIIVHVISQNGLLHEPLNG